MLFVLDEGKQNKKCNNYVIYNEKGALSLPFFDLMKLILLIFIIT